jgi:hypothetical protein
VAGSFRATRTPVQRAGLPDVPQAFDNLAGIEAPHGGRAGPPDAAGRTRGPPEESEASVDAVAASPSLLSNR